MRRQECFGIGKGFAGDGGHQNLGGAFGNWLGPVKGQIIDGVRRAPGQCLAHLGAAGGAAGSGGADQSVKNLVVGDDQLGRQTLRRQFLGRCPHVGQSGVHIRRAEGGRTNSAPAIPRAVQKGDRVMAQIKGECRFHAQRLTWVCG